MTEHFRLVTSDAELNEVVEVLSRSPVLALDTEFMRTDTFFPIPALVQVFDGKECYLLDPLAINDWTSFSELMTRADIAKVFHSVSEDLEVFQRLLGVLPSPLLDTQVGAALAGFGGGVGYQNLVSAVLGVTLEKGETRSNWLQRPLTGSQCHYAAMDVVHLLALYKTIYARLEQLGRVDWWREEGARRIAQGEQAPEPDQYYRKISSAWKLKPDEQGRLKALCAWRERTAREKDVPRGRIIKDPQCVDIAKRRPRQVAELAGITGVPPSAVRRYGEAICELMAQDFRVEAVERLPAPLAGREKEMMKTLRVRLDTLSNELDVPRDVLMNKRDLEATIRSRSLVAELKGWREHLIEPILKEVLV